MNAPTDPNIKLTSFSHGGGGGCKIALGVLAEILKKSSNFLVPGELMMRSPGGITCLDPMNFRSTFGWARSVSKSV